MPSSDCVWLDFELIRSSVSSSSEDVSLSESDEQDDILLKSTLWNNRLIAFFFRLCLLVATFFFNSINQWNSITKSHLHQIVCRTNAMPPQTHLQPLKFNYSMLFCLFIYGESEEKKNVEQSWYRSTLYIDDRVAEAVTKLQTTIWHMPYSMCVYILPIIDVYTREWSNCGLTFRMRRLWHIMRRFHNAFKPFCNP